MTEGLMVIDNRREIVKLKVEVFDILRKLETLQYNANQLVEAKKENLKQITKLEGIVYPSDKEAE